MLHQFDPLIPVCIWRVERTRVGDTAEVLVEDFLEEAYVSLFKYLAPLFDEFELRAGHRDRLSKMS